MKAIEAASIVLEESGTPLHVKEITRLVLSRGLWKTSGKTPSATIGASIYTDIKKNGDTSRFVLHAPSTFVLRKTDSSGKVPAEPRTGTVSQRKDNLRSKTSFSFAESAQKVLERFADRRPMHYRAITDKAIEMGWLSSKGKTPAVSMNAQILVSIKRSRRRGEQPLFTKHGRGEVGLSAWMMTTGLELEIEKHNRKVREQLHKNLLEMDWDAFERLISKFLSEMGFEIEESVSKADGGIDVRGTLLVGDVISTEMAVQVKRWKRNIQRPVVQQVRGSLGAHEQGLIITTSDFSKGAREESERKNATPVALMNGKQLVALLVENEIRVQRRSHYLIELEDEDTSTDEHEN